MADFLETTTLERSATGHTDAEVPPYGDLGAPITPLGTWTSATTSDDALCPAQNGQVTFHVSDSSWMIVNDWIVLVGFGTFKVESKPDATHVIATYLPSSPQTPNTTPLNTLIPSGTRVMVGSFSDTADSSAGLYYRWTDKSHDYIAGGEVDGVGVKAMYNVVKSQGSVAGQVLLAQLYGSTYDYGNGVIADSLSNIYLGGSSVDTINFGNGKSIDSSSQGMFASKFNSEFVCQWATHIAGTSGYSVAPPLIAMNSTKTTLYAFGSVDSNLVLASLNPTTGALNWTKQLTSSGQKLVGGIAIDASDRVIITGSSSGAISGESGGTVAANQSNGFTFIFRYLSNGTSDFSRGFNCDGFNQGNALACDSLGNTFVGGKYNGIFGFAENPATIQSTVGGGALFVVKLNSSLQYVNAKSFGTTDGASYFMTGFAVDGDNNLGLVGLYTIKINFGGSDLTNAPLFAVKLAGSTLDHLWSKSPTHSVVGDQRVSSVSFSPNKDMLLTGYIKGSIDWSNGALPGVTYTSPYNPNTGIQARNIFYARLSTANGACVVNKGFGGTSGDEGYGVSGNSSFAVVTGYSHGGTFGSYVLPGTTGIQIPLIKIAL